MPGVTLLVISYLLLAIFLIAFVVRSVRLAHLPVHLRWELAPVPHDRGRSRYGGSYFEEWEWWTRPRARSHAAEVRYMLQEILFLKAVREHNRPLWRWSLPFHLGLYLLAVALGLLVVVQLLGVVAHVDIARWPAMPKVELAVAGTGYVLGSIGGLGVLMRRLLDPRLKDFRAPAALFNLALLLAVFATGLVSLAGTNYAGGAATYVRALFAGDAVTLPPLLAAHVMLTLVFLAYLPFSQMMHFVAKYSTYHEVRWDDAPMTPGSRLERRVQTLLGLSPTWQAPHLATDGRKNWVDIASMEIRP